MSNAEIDVHNKRVVLSGKPEKGTRKELLELLARAGADVVKSITYDTDFVILGHPPSQTAMRNATKRSVAMLSADAVLASLKAQETELQSGARIQHAKARDFALGGELIATGAKTEVHLWDLASREKRGTIKRPGELGMITLSDDGRLLALSVPLESEPYIAIYDASTLSERALIPARGRWTTAMTWVGHHLAAVWDGSNEVTLFDADGAETQRWHLGPAEGSPAGDSLQAIRSERLLVGMTHHEEPSEGGTQSVGRAALFALGHDAPKSLLRLRGGYQVVARMGGERIYASLGGQMYLHYEPDHVERAQQVREPNRLLTVSADGTTLVHTDELRSAIVIRDASDGSERARHTGYRDIAGLELAHGALWILQEGRVSRLDLA